MPLDIATIDERMDAALEAVIDRLAREALAELHAMAVFSQRSFAQRARRIKERMRKDGA